MRIGLSPRPKNHLINKNISPHCVILNFSLDKIKTFFTVLYHYISLKDLNKRKNNFK